MLSSNVEDDGVAQESYGLAIIAALGMERRNEVLARLYIARSDVQYTVRSAAMHVWKTLVVNTPKTLSEVLPGVMEEVRPSLSCLRLFCLVWFGLSSAAGRHGGGEIGLGVLAFVLPCLVQGITWPQARSLALVDAQVMMDSTCSCSPLLMPSGAHQGQLSLQCYNLILSYPATGHARPRDPNPRYKSGFSVQVIESLACEGEDRRLTAGRCLGELVRKMGDRVLVRIIPILRDGLSSESSDTRQGVCFGLKEVGASSLEKYFPMVAIGP